MVEFVQPSEHPAHPVVSQEILRGVLTPPPSDTSENTLTEKYAFPQRSSRVFHLAANYKHSLSSQLLEVIYPDALLIPATPRVRRRCVRCPRLHRLLQAAP